MKKKINLVTILVFTVFTTNAQSVDIALLKQINVNRNVSLDPIFRGITNSTIPAVVGAPVILFVVGVLSKDSITRQKAYHIGSSLLISDGISVLLKYAINRPRPTETYPFIEDVSKGSSRSFGGTPSFPSGHTCEAFSLATSLSMSYPKWYVIAPSFVWAGLVGYSRMDLGIHYPSDVLAGAIIGSGSAYLCFKAQCWIKKKYHSGKAL